MTGLMKVTWKMKLLTLVLQLEAGLQKQQQQAKQQTGREVKTGDLHEKNALRLKLDTHAMTTVVQEVLQTKELQSTELPPVPPVHSDLQLPGLASTCNTTVVDGG